MLAERLTTDLQAVAADGHLRLYGIEPPPATAADSAPRPAAEDRRTIPGIRDIKWLEPGVAYLAFEHFGNRAER